MVAQPKAEPNRHRHSHNPNHPPSPTICFVRDEWGPLNPRTALDSAIFRLLSDSNCAIDKKSCSLRVRSLSR
ncbi:unnamed protein product [Cylicocyclus nassatus]|uniref:Uncharacterized protein n=1 Tax=Cylicocyclus nassatus TaxID=53992 RepID=A0AA36DTT8_CYLNA|nr:unnamed protein product [Cylicocyclus nassatus]